MPICLAKSAYVVEQEFSWLSLMAALANNQTNHAAIRCRIDCGKSLRPNEHEETGTTQ